MAIQTVNIGTTPNDGTGDPARTAFTKVNDNFTAAENAASKLVATTAQAIAGTADVLTDAAGVHAAIRGLSVGTVSQSGGVPTGAIIERGSNANGEYVKYADGTMICRRNFEISSVNTATFTEQNINYFRIRDVWTFPAGFITASNMDISALASQNSDDVLVTTKYRNLTNTDVLIDSISIISFSSFARMGTSCVAIGRWY